MERKELAQMEGGREEQLSHSRRMEAVGRLAGGIAHEFNNITQSISLCCELALHSKPGRAVESKLLDIMKQAERAAEITRHLLAFSRRQVLQPKVVNINDCIREALPMLQHIIGADIDLQLKLDETVDHAFIDPEQLAIVMAQLAHNARSAMPKGGSLHIATSRASGRRAEAKRLEDDRGTLITVSDSGPGMNRAALSRIFEPFFSNSEMTVTTGFGLSTVHGIITQSNGRIKCQSAPGRGTTFRISLPPASSGPAEAGCVRDYEGRGGSNILLAEDDPVVNKYLTYALRSAGFTVDSVRDGRQALEALGQASHHLLITDILMPHMSGLELVQQARKQLPELPVVLISGFTEEIAMLQKLPPGKVAFMQKPFPCTKLLETVSRLLNLQGTMMQPEAHCGHPTYHPAKATPEMLCLRAGRNLSFRARLRARRGKARFQQASASFEMP